MPAPTIITAYVKYPATKQQPVINDYFGTKVTDPYQWLEDDNSEATKAWVVAENEITQQYLSAIPFHAKVKQRLAQLWDYPKYGVPFRKAGQLFYFKNDGLQNQSVLYRQSQPKVTPEVFFDPNKLSADGTIALGELSFSKNGRYVAYTIAGSGSDWNEAYIMDVLSGEFLTGHLQWIKFSSLSWKGEEGFYYSRYPEPDEQDMLSGQNQFHKVYYHKVGTPQSADVLIYEDKEHPLRTAVAFITEDNRFLIVNSSEGTSGINIRVKELKQNADNPFTILIPGFDTEPSVIDNVGGKLLVQTNHDAPNYKLVLIDPAYPEVVNWITIIPEKPEAMQSVSTGGGYLFVSYLKDAASKVYQYTYDGQVVREIELPGIGTASDFGGEQADLDFYYRYTSFNYPPAIFHYDIATGVSTLFRRSEANFDPNGYETIEVFVPSTDGALVPMFLTYRKGLVRDGRNPVLLYGYGGFNIAMTPAFSISNAFFLEQGGIYAQVSLRGGSEYGEAWHQAGMLHQKQQVFDDMIASAEYLLTHGYTSIGKIAVKGGSNGGLLVGACMTQRPDLFQVALPQVGVLDMLRFQQFTIGWAWVVEYGTSENKEDFDYLYRYSPYHNLKPGISYPATLITTADHDDRVVPAHSFKFAARLQECNAGQHPMLIRIDSKAGHGAGKPTSKVIEEAADVWSFVLFHLEMTFQEQ